jgi:hypothetical protein
MTPIIEISPELLEVLLNIKFDAIKDSVERTCCAELENILEELDTLAYNYSSE